MLFTKVKMISAGMIMAAGILAFGPQQASASVAEVQSDGVMGQSLEDETVYEEDLDSLILKASRASITPALLSTTSSTYTDTFLSASFTTEGEYTSATYYHKGDYEDYALINGIDVSWWQGDGKGSAVTNLDWEAIHDAGIDFAFVRAASRDTADGSIYEDTCADAHIQGALDNDINVGLYIFSQALTQKEAVEEAEYVLNLIDSYGWNDISMPIVIDREAGSYKRLTAGSLTKTKETAICQAFADTITEAGYDACVYASYSWINNYINTNTLTDCSVWIARYNNTTTSNSKSGTPYSDVAYDYEFWQYSSVAKVDGYSGSLDVDFWYKDVSTKTTGLKMSANTADSITLSWSAAGDAYAYRVYRYDEEQQKYIYLGATKNRTYTDTGLTGGSTYQYRVRCYWTIGGTKYYGTYSSPVQAMTLPAKVTGVSVSARTSTTMTLTWKAAKNVTGYRIYKYDDATGGYVGLGNVAAGTTSYKVAGLTNASEYQFKVRAYQKVDGVTYWGSCSTVLTSVTKPSKVSTLTLTSTSATSIKLTWKKISRATGYQIYRLNTTTGAYEKVTTIKSPNTVTYTDTGLTSNKEYTYKVRAYLSYGGTNYYGTCSDVQSVVTKPSKVKSLSLSTKSSAVTLTWSKVARATGYQIYRLNTTTGKYEKVITVKGVNTCTYKNTGLKKGATYTYKVRAYRAYGGKNYFGTCSAVTKIVVK